MRLAGHDLHIDCYGSPLAVGHTEICEQTVHRALLGNRPLFAVNGYFNHHRRLLTKKKAAALGMRPSLSRAIPRTARLQRIVDAKSMALPYAGITQVRF